MKSKSFRIVATLLGAIVVLSAVIITTVQVKEYIADRQAAEQAQREAELERLAQEELADTYVRANYAFRFTYASRYDDDYRMWAGVYLPIENLEQYNRFGVDYQIYLTLKYYEKMTSVVLGYQTVVDYLSKEYEPDGTLRLYNNGGHPEIEAFVDWMWQQREDQYANMTSQEMWDIAPGHAASGSLVKLEAYISSLEYYYRTYKNDPRYEDFEIDQFNRLSPQMYDELVRKEADPSYEMDLLSLQQQGY